MVVEQMNGEISCESEEGKGTTISFYITVKCKLNDYGISEDLNVLFNNDIKKNIRLSKNLIQNLYMDDDCKSQNSN
jgi:hypothetical protein